VDGNAHAEIGRGKRIVFAAIAIAAVLAIVELAAFGSGKFLQAKYKMYVVPTVQRSEWFKGYDDYLKRRDPRLGWPYAAESGGSLYDASGSRRSPAFPDPKSPNAVSVFGDSFAYGTEVDDEHAWANQLAKSLGARVGNFGVPGYGTDQSYLRHSLGGETSRVVILTHLSEGILRHLTRDWDLITHMGYYAMKPRFVLDAQGALREVPLPNLSEHEYLRSVGIEAPLLRVEHENFQPGGAAGVVELEFPYTVALLRNLGAYQVRALFARRPDHAEFYRRDHPLQGLQITAKILQAFQDAAVKRGQWPLVVLLPTMQDMTYAKRTGHWSYAPLVEELDRAMVSYIDFGPALLKHIGERDPRPFFMPLRHYNEEINKLLADAVYEALRSRGALSESAPTPRPPAR
jgi:hypothetical protein